jgi:hypothetical protein
MGVETIGSEVEEVSGASASIFVAESSGARAPITLITTTPTTDQIINFFLYASVFGPRAHNKNGSAKPTVKIEITKILIPERCNGRLLVFKSSLP